MATDRKIKELVAKLHVIACDNKTEAGKALDQRHCDWLEGRADAYRLAAGWLEELVEPDEEDKWAD
ncbi:MAG: hypothetical protein ABIH46_10750 [Chloroflexota bacterium]